MDSLEQKSRGFVLGLAGGLVVKSMLMENDVEFVSKGRQAGRRSKVEGFLDEEAKRFGILVRGPYRREEHILAPYLMT